MTSNKYQTMHVYLRLKFILSLIAAYVFVISEQTDLAENAATVAEEMKIIASNNESHIDGIEEVNSDSLGEEPIPDRSLTDDEISQINATIATVWTI